MYQSSSTSFFPSGVCHNRSIQRRETPKLVVYEKRVVNPQQEALKMSLVEEVTEK